MKTFTFRGTPSNYRLFLFIFLFFQFLYSFAQVQDLAYCQTYQDENDAYQTINDNTYDDKSVPFFLRVFVHVINNSNGEGGLSDSQVYEALEILNKDFNPHNIFFVWDCYIDPINNDDYFSALEGTPSIFNVNSNTEGIDIYLFPDHPPLTNSGKGEALIPIQSASNLAFYVSGNFAQTPFLPLSRTRVISHEMAHCLGLYHTHGVIETGLEPLDGGDCATDTYGDLICDTPPDPNMLFNVNPETCMWQGVFPLSSEINNYNPDTENIMGNTVPTCMERFSPEQVSRMRNQIREREILKKCLVENVINENTQWDLSNTPSGEVIINGPLIIESGNNLTIGENVSVKFSPNGRLIVKPNATLFLSGTLTSNPCNSSCEFGCGGTWKGVEVWGESSKSQYPIGGTYAQGRFFAYEGSRIENAEIGVQLWGGIHETNTYLNTGGGQIYCADAVFLNNGIAVDFAPYDNFWPFETPVGQLNQPRNYKATFLRCIFETNQSYPHDEGFSVFLDLNAVNGIKIIGGRFSNTQQIENCSGIHDYGYGIYSSDSGFKVLADCISQGEPCTEYERPLFFGLGYGIYTQSSIINRPFTVKQADFENCYAGIYNQAVTGATVVLNRFKLGNTSNPDCPLDFSEQMGNSPDPYLTFSQVGVVFEQKMAGFTLEQNTFVKAPGNVETTIGTACSFLGLHSNYIRNNYYEGLSHANVAWGLNGDFSFNLDDISGLRYVCNTNQDITEYDIAVVETSFDIDNISRKQGVPNLSTNPIKFYDPTNIFTQDVDPENNNHFYNPTNDNTPVIEYYSNDNADDDEKPEDTFGLTVVDDGQLYTCVDNFCDPPCKTQSEIDLIKLQYYEDKESYEENREEYFLAFQSGNMEVAEEKGLAAAFYHEHMEKNAYTVYVHMLYDTTGFDREQLRLWIDNMDTYNAKLLLAQDYFSTGDIEAAQLVIDEIPEKFDLMPFEMEDLNNLKNLYSELSDKNIYELEQGSISLLETSALSSTGQSSRTFAKAVLSLNKRYFPLILYLPPVRQKDKKIINLQNNKFFGASGVTVYPNPAKNDVTFNFKVLSETSSIQLIITNALGNVLVKEQIFETTVPFSWDVRDRTSGVYFYQINSGSKFIDSGRIIIKK